MIRIIIIGVVSHQCLPLSLRIPPSHHPLAVEKNRKRARDRFLCMRTTSTRLSSTRAQSYRLQARAMSDSGAQYNTMRGTTQL